MCEFVFYLEMNKNGKLSYSNRSFILSEYNNELYYEIISDLYFSCIVSEEDNIIMRIIGIKKGINNKLSYLIEKNGDFTDDENIKILYDNIILIPSKLYNNKWEDEEVPIYDIQIKDGIMKLSCVKIKEKEIDIKKGRIIEREKLMITTPMLILKK